MSHQRGVFTGQDHDFEAALSLLGMARGVDHLHRFEPHGVSWARVDPQADPWLVTLHSWPEHGLVAVDRWGSPFDLAAALQRLGWVSSPEEPRPLPR